MSKRFISVLLAVTVLCAATACRQGGTSADTDSDGETRPDTSVTEDSGGTADSLPEDPSPHEPLVPLVAESLTLDGKPLVDGDIGEGLRAANYTVSIPEGETVSVLELTGWVSYAMAVDRFGYRIDGGEAVYGLFATYTEDELREAGGPYALRFTLTVPLFSLGAGAHTVSLLARLADGSEVPLLHDLTLSLESVSVDPTVPYRSSVTRVCGNAYEGRGGSSEYGVDILDAKLGGMTVGQDRLLSVSGWLALEGGVERYVWSADGVTWFPARSNGYTGEPSEGYFASLGYENATENALFSDLVLDLTPCNGRNVAVTVGGVPKNAPDTVVPFITVTGLDVPKQARDIDCTFLTRADHNPEGTDLASSELGTFFDVSYGAGDPRCVTSHDGSLCYCYGGIHSFQTTTDGRFALTAEVTSMTGASFLFVRGVRTVRSVDPVPISLNTFYETDGAGLCGGAGIYAKLSDGVLTLVIKALDPDAAYRVKNCIYEFPAAGSRLTLADDGATVYILVDGREITRVTLNGFTEYPEHFEEVSPYAQFAATATVVLPDGRTETVRNTLVAATCESQCGAAIRGGALHFTELSVVPFSESELPAE